MFSPTQKKVAFASNCFKRSRTRGVTDESGPSSNVRYKKGPVAGMRHVTDPNNNSGCRHKYQQCGWRLHSLLKSTPSVCLIPGPTVASWSPPCSWLRPHGNTDLQSVS